MDQACPGFTRLGRDGLDWAWVGWTGLNWARVECFRASLGMAGMDWTVLDWAALGCSGRVPWGHETGAVTVAPCKGLETVGLCSSVEGLDLPRAHGGVR